MIIGSGKTTFAARVASIINELQPGAAVVLPMDGYHLTRKQLDQLPVQRSSQLDAESNSI